MSIQSNINQGLSLTGLLITQTAGYKNAAKAHELDTQAKKVEKQAEIISKPGFHGLGYEKGAALKELNEKSLELKKEAFDIAPSKRRLEEYSRDASFKRASEQHARMRELADANTKAMQAAKLETRKRILTGTPSEYLLKEDK